MKTEKEILLKACYDLLQKQDNSVFVLNLLEEEIKYHGASCDGYCLMEDIKIELDIE